MNKFKLSNACVDKTYPCIFVSEDSTSFTVFVKTKKNGNGSTLTTPVSKLGVLKTRTVSTYIIHIYKCRSYIN